MSCMHSTLPQVLRTGSETVCRYSAVARDNVVTRSRVGDKGHLSLISSETGFAYHDFGWRGKGDSQMLGKRQLHHILAGTMDAHMAASVATVNGMEPGVRKRGAKPKYKFMTAEEAIAHRFPLLPTSEHTAPHIPYDPCLRSFQFQSRRKPHLTL